MTHSSDNLRPELQIIGVAGISEVQPDDDLGPMIVAAADAQGTPIRTGDVLVVTQKIVSKAEGRLVDLDTVEPSGRAIELATPSRRDPRVVELVLRESRSIVRTDLDRGVIITETHHGFVCANAGIDASNVPGDDFVALLPKDPDRSAASIRRHVEDAVGGAVAVIISDTFGRAWREGHVNFAIGVAGMAPIRDYRGSVDAVGKELKVTQIAEVDELACATELVMAKADQIPVAIVRGHRFTPEPGSFGPLIRDPSTDLFR